MTYLEWLWKAGREGSNFPGGSPQTQNDQIWQSNIGGEISRNQPVTLPIPKGWAPSSPKFLGPTYARTVCSRAIKFGTATHVGEERVPWSSTHPVPRSEFQRPQNFWDPYLRPYCLAWSDQIWYGDISGEEGHNLICMVIKLDVRINLAGSTTPLSILAKLFGDTHSDVLANFLTVSIVIVTVRVQQCHLNVSLPRLRVQRSRLAYIFTQLC